MPIILQSKDNVIFHVEKAVGDQLLILRDRKIPENYNKAVRLSQVSSEILEKVIEYCKRRAKSKYKKDDYEYLDLDNTKTLNDLLQAADYLKVESLQDLLFQCVTRNLSRMQIGKEWLDDEDESDSEEEEEEEDSEYWDMIGGIHKWVFSGR